MGIVFTPEQQQVIEVRNKSVLVSAAAGSGKTAVLVERIVSMICDEQNPRDIDRLLVVTFTSAAAAEMRERIHQAIEARLFLTPDNVHLQRQAALLHNAQITTIDSFCLFVIRNNFNDIGLDPAFRVMDEGEGKLLKQEALQDVFEEYYEEENAGFYQSIEACSPKGSDKPFGEQVLKLYEFAMSFPWPEEFLQKAPEDYRNAEEETVWDTAWFQSAVSYCTGLLEDMLAQLETGERICEEADGPYMYSEVLEADKEILNGLLTRFRKKDGTLSEVLKETGFGRLPSKKDDSVSTEKREAVKKIRQEMKDTVTGIRADYFYDSMEKLCGDMREATGRVEILSELTLRFMKHFDEKKREKNLIDFHDMEHLALQILAEKEENGYRATKAAADYRQYFEEILIDEYQDSNLVQEALLYAISGEEDGKYNRFMVGDVKQSIYKFRLARPELFMEKYDSYTEAGEREIRIDLHKNFRSRKEVVRSVNAVFHKIMRKKPGNVEYDEKAYLYEGAAYPEEKADYQTELLLCEDGENAKETEAMMIASRIRQMEGTFPVMDKQSGSLRPVAYSDMVILLRTNSGWDDIFQKVLTAEGIPVHAASKTGYFQAVEIQTLLNYLKVIDNPLQDIPLYGVLKSSFGGFTEEEIARIKASADQENRRLYEKLVQAGKEENGNPKISCFLERLEHYRSMTPYTSILHLIQTILSDTGYWYEAGAMPAGEQRQANVEMLLSKAADFEKTSYYGLFHFIRYMEQMEKYDIDYGEASILDENSNTVRIMSIHKSKGLEFPICFVAGLTKRFNQRDTSGALLMDVDMGIGMEYADVDNRLRQPTLKKNAVSAKMRMDGIGEELRVLYVAMTRAKEKMILTAVVGNMENVFAEAKRYAGQSGQLPFYKIMKAGSYLDMLLPAVLEEETVRITTVQKEELAGEQITEEITAHGQRLRLKNPPKESHETAELKEQLLQRFSFTYPHENLSRLVTKTTVSELKKAGMEEALEKSAFLYAPQEKQSYIPRFMGQEEQKDGAFRGTAFHKAMELLRFEGFSGLRQEEYERQLFTQTEQMKADGRLSAAYEEVIDFSEIRRFLQTKLAQRMIKAAAAGKLYQEQPFVYGVSADRLDSAFPGEETVLVQGIVDVYFEEEGKLVVADYKTDAVKKPEELTERYRTQLDYYSEALSRMTGMECGERILYSFAMGFEISV